MGNEMTTDALGRGKKLPNNATIIDYRRVAAEHYVILALRNDNSEFVTWHSDAEGNCYWGNYHTEISAAVQDYLSR
jgi:hypothetical protein